MNTHPSNPSRPGVFPQSAPTDPHAGALTWRRGVLAVTVVGMAAVIAWGLQSDRASPASASASPAVAELERESAVDAPAGSDRVARDAAGAHSTRVAVRDPVLGLRRGTASLESLIALAAEDAGFRADLRRRHALTSDPELRATLLELLQSAPLEEQLAFAYQLLADADPQRRADGYRVLGQLPLDDPRVLDSVRRGLHEETDPAALSVLVAGMQPGLLATEDARPIAAELAELTQHGDPRVRASVLSQLSSWISGVQLEAPYFAALSDPDPAVRAAAIAGIGVSQARSARLLDALFALAANSQEPAEHRHHALQALLGFPLTRAEIDLYRLLQAEVPLHPGRG